MKTKLISIVFVLSNWANICVAQDSEPSTSIVSIQPILHGSLLCGDEVKRITKVPSTLKDKWFLNTKAEIDSNKRTIQLKYYFKTPDGSLPFVNPLRDTLITTLNEKLPKNIDLHLNEAHLDWSFKEQYLLDDTLYNSNLISVIDIDLYLRKANPFQKCFTIENTCGKLQVVRHEVRPICPSYGIYTKYGINLNKTVTYSEKLGKKDTIYNTIAELSFEDSIVQYAVVCLAVGNTIRRDTINFSNITDRTFNDFIIKEHNIQEVICVTTPCYPLEYNVVYSLGYVTLSTCLKTGIDKEDFVNEIPYPNPATEKLYVKGVSSIILTDILGNKSKINGDGEFNIEGLKSGLYLLNYEINGENYSSKILIQ